VRAAIELICFDLDGTLVDSAPDLCVALGHALQSVGLNPPGEAQTRGWIGDGIDRLLRRALDDAGSHDQEVFRSALGAFHECYAQNLFSRSRLYPEVDTVLSRLSDSQYRLCCITNKRCDYARALLAQAGILQCFGLVFGGDTFEQKKPHARQLLEAARRVNAEPANCVMIGDSDTDAEAAAAAGFGFLWAAFGYCRALSSRAVTATPQVAEFREIPAALAAMLPQT